MFHFVCGELTVKTHRLSLMSLVKKAYKLYFGCNVRDQDKRLAPHICCGTCASKVKKSGYKVHDQQCPLQYRWYGLSKKITSETVISA